jgi:hypothetical protein
MSEKLASMAQKEAQQPPPPPPTKKRNKYLTAIHNTLFAGIPEHLPLRKKLDMLLSTNSRVGLTWDVLLIGASLIASSFYIVETYLSARWPTVQWLHDADTVFTSVFTVDFAFRCFVAPNVLFYLVQLTTLIDLATFVPYYVQLAVQGLKLKLSIFRFLKIYRLIRIMRIFKSMRSLSGPIRQMIVLMVTLFCFVLIGAGIFQLFENDVKQLVNFQCNYVGPDFLPSCDPVLPFEPDCDCIVQQCSTFYNPYDPEGQPSGVACGQMSYFKAVYFVVVTVGTLGYGDVFPTTAMSRAMVLVLMLGAFVVIPMQVQELTEALAKTSIYRQPHKRVNEDDKHVIVCGNVNNRLKVERFLSEFYHPTRALTRDTDIKIVLLSPMEPNEDIKSLLFKDAFISRVSYLVGSALSIDDLKKAGARYATAVFFLSNSAVDDEGAALDDAANILRSLNFINYNSRIECYAQIIRSADGEILRDSKVVVILCLDEFRSTMQARNAVCPGISTLIENLFTTFGELETVQDLMLSNTSTLNESWLSAYNHGTDMEVYYVTLPPKYLAVMGYHFPLMAEGVFVEFGAMLMGVCCKSEMSMILNPSSLEMHAYDSPEEFFKVHDTAVLLVESYEMAHFITQSLSKDDVIEKIIARMMSLEESCHVRTTEGEAEFLKSLAAEASSKRMRKGSMKASVSSLRRASGQKIGSEKSSSLLRWNFGTDRGGVEKVPPTELYKTLEMFKFQQSAHAERCARHTASASSSQQNLVAMVDSENAFLGHNRKTSDGAVNVAMTEAAARRERRKQRQHRRSLNSMTGADGVSAFDPDGFGESDDDGDGDELASSAPATPRAHLAMPVSTPATPQSLRVSIKGDGKIKKGKLFGHASCELESATHLDGHIIVFGSGKTLRKFVMELRKPLVSVGSYRPIVFVSNTAPDDWKQIMHTCDDVYWIKGDMLVPQDFNRAHVKSATSVVLLANRENLAVIDQDSLDTSALFAYLELEKYIPNHVFFTIELMFESNISSLNSSMMPRLQAEMARNEAIAKEKSLHDLLGGDMHVGAGGGGGLGGWFGSTRIHIGGEGSDLPNGSAHGKAHQPAAVAATPTTSGKAPSIEGGDDEAGWANTKKKRHIQFDVSGRSGGGGGKNVSRPSTPVLLGSQKRSAGSTASARDAQELFNIFSTHHTLPIFASGSAFVPTAMYTILANCFFDPLAPLMCERLLCGQRHKTMFLLDVPPAFVGRHFVDLYRTFMALNLFVLGLRRAASFQDKSLLPYVYTCPRRSAELHAGDQLFVYCSPTELDYAVQHTRAFALTFTKRAEWQSAEAARAEEVFLVKVENIEPYTNTSRAYDVELSKKMKEPVSSSTTGAQRTSFRSDRRES